MKAWAILAAAGTGERLGLSDGIPKAMRPVAGVPMFIHSLRAFDAVEAVEAVVLVVDELWMEHALSTLVDEQLRVKLEMVHGGDSRQASVRQGLKTVPSGVDAVIVHDAARPLVRPAMIERVFGALLDADAAVAAVPVQDTIKRVEGDVIVDTVPREHLRRAQTPQAFRTEVLRDAHARAAREGWNATDDALLVERAGGDVRAVDGEPRNIKITTLEDLTFAELLLEKERGS